MPANNPSHKTNNALLSPDCNYIDPIVQLLEVEAESWHYTSEYIETGLVQDGILARDASTAEEAEIQALFYDDIISKIQKQASPTWIDSQGCDAETLAELTREMSEFFLQNDLHLEDSRCFYRLCIDMARIFQSDHEDTDWQIVDFLTYVMRFAKDVKKKLLEFPNWINSDYRFMYGKETLKDLLSKVR
jgi:hypothetical protein